MKIYSILFIIVILISCTHNITQKASEIQPTKSNEAELFFSPEDPDICVASRIIQYEDMIGFRIDDINFNLDDIDYTFKSYNPKGRMIEEGFYIGTGIVPYMWELHKDAAYVIISKE